jgi:hypothetical protein
MKKTHLILGIVAALMLVLSSVVFAKNANPGVLPPQSKPNGMTYGEWSAKWWQWAYSLPVIQNPFFDEDNCSNGANGQFGPVWFLTGVINTSGIAVRDCTVPAGKKLFFPVLNIECATLEGNGATPAELLACVEPVIKTVTNVECEIDGVPLKNLKEDYFVTSPPFIYGPLPDNNVLQSFGFDAPAGATSLALTQGYYLMLAPLPVGHHTLRFTGTFGDPFNFTLDVTYNLTIAPGKP